MGRSRPVRGVGRLRTPLPQRLMERLPGVDVRIVADRARRPTADRIGVISGPDGAIPEVSDVHVGLGEEA
jgi:hypothetical protein